MSRDDRPAVPRGTQPLEEVGSCLLCGASSSVPDLQVTDHTVSKDVFSIQRCPSCGFRYTSPRPDQDHIGTYYLSADYVSHAAEAVHFRDRIYRWVRRFAIRQKHQLIAQHQPHGVALDMGCGTGDFPAYLARHGYTAYGVEVSDQARRIARAKGLPVAASLAALSAELRFDLITLWHVLEHVEDPRTVLSELHDKAQPGALLVIAVPDSESWDCAHYGADWAAWDVPRHFWHFRRSDLHRLLRETGFELLDTRRMWFDAFYVGMLSEQYRGAGPLRSLITGGFTGLWSNAVAFFGKRPTSSSLFIARKTSNLGKGQNP